MQKQVFEADAKKKAELAEQTAAATFQDEGPSPTHAAGSSGDQNPKSSEVSRPIRVGDTVNIVAHRCDKTFKGRDVSVVSINEKRGRPLSN